ncbi:MAG: type II secretion system protein, partial [Pseudomonadales bacterium]
MENRRIGELLIDAKIVHPQDVEKALQLQAAAGGRLGTILFRTGALSEEALLRVLALQLDAPVLGVDAPIPDESQMLQGALESGIPLDWFLDQRVLMWQMPDGTIGWTAQDPLASLVLQSLAARSAGA